MDNQKALEIIKNYGGRPVRIMEVCGTHTHAIFQYGIRQILPAPVRLISGPGCPVCVTEPGYIDEAVELALDKGAVIATFGDLVRVPGSSMSLQKARAEGAEVKVVYSPLDALAYAKEHPEKQVVFLSVGFETTAPAACLAVKKAKDEGVGNFYLLVANKTMDQAYRALSDSADAFLYPGHVSAITGMEIYRELVKEGISGAVCGFTPAEILTALAVILTKLERGEPFAENCYPRVVTEEGSRQGRALMRETMEPCDAVWRGIGMIPGSGLRLNEAYRRHDARAVFGITQKTGRQNPACRCGDILMGRITPKECPLFGKTCTPEEPVGACMVSSEGTCSAYYKYGTVISSLSE
jgi:hydrogenase expression/formation protein HypD